MKSDMTLRVSVEHQNPLVLQPAEASIRTALEHALCDLFEQWADTEGVPVESATVYVKSAVLGQSDGLLVMPDARTLAAMRGAHL